MRLLEFGRSTILFRIDLDVLPPKTLSHKPPFAMNNARIQIDSVCRVTERDTGQVHTFVLGGDCKTERVGATADLFLEPNADFIPIFSDRGFMHIKTFARAGTKAQAYPPGSGEQSDRLTARIVDTFVDAHLDLVEREGERLADGEAIVDSILANDVIVGVHRLGTDRYDVEIEYPAKTINGNERDIVYQTDTGRSCGRTSRATRTTCCPVSSSPSRPPTRPIGPRSSCAAGRRSPTASRSTTTPTRSGWRASPTSSTGSPTPHRRPAGGSTSWRTPRPPKRGPS